MTRPDKLSKEAVKMQILPLRIDEGRVFWEVYTEVEGMDPYFSCCRILERSGLKVLNIHASMSDERGVMLWLVDATNSKVSPGELQERLAAMSGVLEARVNPCALPGMGIHGSLKLTVGGAPVVVITEGMLSIFLNMLKDEWGSAGMATMYKIGTLCGMEVYKYLTDELGLEGDKALDALLNLGAGLGWWLEARTKQSTGGEIAKIEVFGGLECRSIRRDEANSHFLRGFLAGFFSSMLGEDVEVREVRCEARGDSCCEFVVRTRGNR